MNVLRCSSAAEAYVYATCVFLGISMLMPLNALTSAPRYMVDYYKYVTGNPDAVPNSPVFWANILTFYNLVSVVSQIIVGPTVLTPCARKLSLTVRFILALSFMMLEVLVVLVMPTGHVSQVGAMVAFFIVTIAAGAGKSYLEATCYALAGSMDPKFMSAVMFGCGFSGVIASTLQCIIKASMPNTYESVLQQSYIYFSLALAFMAVALIMALCLRFNSYAQAHVGEFRKLRADQHVDDVSKNPAEPAAFTEATGDIVMDTYEVEGEAKAKSAPERDDVDPEEVQIVRNGDDDFDMDSIENQQHMSTAEQLQRTAAWPVAKIIYPSMISCFLIFFVSLFIFPSLVIAIDRESEWFSTIGILLYNCGDATGRFSSSFKFLWPPQKAITIVALCRFIFIPLVFLCIYSYIPGHVFPYIMLPIIGLTKGFFGATSMVYGPNNKGLKTEGQKVMAGQLMGISLLAGASVSALLALLVILFI